MSLCLAAGGKITALAFTAFTLSWTHSVERVRWNEDWQLTNHGLLLTQARVQGSGAGMEPGADAIFREGWWRWTPKLPPQNELLLAASGATSGGWTLCGSGAAGCLDLGATPSEPIRIAGCTERDPEAD